MNSGSGPTNNAMTDEDYGGEWVRRDVEAYASQRQLACLICGRTFQRAAPLPMGEYAGSFAQQPSEGTAFFTYGHYGSTFWDSLSGEQVCVVICDPCLRAAPRDRLAYVKKVREHPSIWKEFDPTVAPLPSDPPEGK